MTGAKDPFFSLRTPFSEMTEAREFFAHLERSNHLKDVLYRPDELIGTSPAKGRRRPRIANAVFENVSFAKTIIKFLDFRDCTFSECLFIGSTIEDCEFHDCIFKECNMHRVEIKNTYVDPSSFDKSLNPKKHTNIGVHLFQQLMKNYKDADQPIWLAEAEFRFLVWARRSKSYEFSVGKKRSFGVAVDITKNYLYEKLLGYGIHMRNFVATSACGLFLILASNWYFWDTFGLEDKARSEKFSKLIDVMYFTIVTISSGMADVIPNSWIGRLLIPFEVFLGLLWLAVLASMVFRKITR